METPTNADLIYVPSLSSDKLDCEPSLFVSGEHARASGEAWSFSDSQFRVSCVELNGDYEESLFFLRTRK